MNKIFNTNDLHTQQATKARTNQSQYILKEEATHYDHGNSYQKQSTTPSVSEPSCMHIYVERGSFLSLGEEISRGTSIQLLILL